MSTPEYIDPLSIVPWDNEAERIAVLLEAKGGEWVVAAAYIDYAHLKETTSALRSAFSAQRPIRLSSDQGRALLLADTVLARDNAELILGVEREARSMVNQIPVRLRNDVYTEGVTFLEHTAGHYAVSTLVEELKPMTARRPDEFSDFVTV